MIRLTLAFLATSLALKANVEDISADLEQQTMLSATTINTPLSEEELLPQKCVSSHTSRPGWIRPIATPVEFSQNGNTFSDDPEITITPNDDESDKTQWLPSHNKNHNPLILNPQQGKSLIPSGEEIDNEHYLPDNGDRAPTITTIPQHMNLVEDICYKR